MLRIVSAAVMLPVVFGAVCLGGWFFGVLLASGCHKKTQTPEPYVGASVVDEERDIVNEVVPDSARRADSRSASRPGSIATSG